MATPIEPPGHLTEQFKEVLAVQCICIDRFTAITTRPRMVEITTKFNANGPRHGVEPTPANATMLDLAPCASLP